MDNSGQARCYSLTIDALPPFAEAQVGMPARRRQALRAFARHEDKLRCVAGWLLLSAVLGPAAAGIHYGRYGKPFLPDGPYFSLSHSGRYVILAVAPMPVGADVEVICQGEDYMVLAAHALHPDEQAFLSMQPEAQTFFDIWTLKESWLKLKGVGLNVAPADFAVSMDCAAPYIRGRTDIHFRLYHQLPGYSVAICLYRCLPPPAIVALQL